MTLMIEPQPGPASPKTAIVENKCALNSKRQQQLTRAAGEFEALFLQQLLKDAFTPAPEDTPGSEAKDAGGETLAGYGVEALSRSIAAGGGFGLRQQIIRAVEHQAGEHGDSEAGCSDATVKFTATSPI